MLLPAGGAAAHPSRGIVATADGRVLFSDLGRLWMISNIAGTALDRGGGFVFRQGFSLRRIAPDRGVRTLAHGLAVENFGIAVAGNSVLVAEAKARRVVRVDPGGRRSIAASSARRSFPTGVAVARGSMFVLEATDPARGVATRMRVRRVDRGGRARVLATVGIPL